MLFLSVRGFLDYAGPTGHSRFTWPPCCLPPTQNEVGILIYGLFAAQSPRPPMPLSTLQEIPRDVPSKTRGQDGFATSFPVGLLHPLQHAGLSRRSPDCPSLESNAPLDARSGMGYVLYALYCDTKLRPHFTTRIGLNLLGFECNLIRTCCSDYGAHNDPGDTRR